MAEVEENSHQMFEKVKLHIEDVRARSTEVMNLNTKQKEDTGGASNKEIYDLCTDPNSIVEIENDLNEVKKYFVEDSMLDSFRVKYEVKSEKELKNG